MLITVALCTRNNCELLERTLESLAGATESASDDYWALIVVNNRSTDNTEEVLEKYRDGLPLRDVYEPKPGLSNARNRAVDEVHRGYNAWLDDVLVDGFSSVRGAYACIDHGL